MIEPSNSPVHELKPGVDFPNIRKSNQGLKRTKSLSCISVKNENKHNPDKRWDKAVKNFLTTTSLHGISHLPTSTPKQKRLWLSAVFVCSVILIIHTSFLLYNAYTRPAFFTTLTYEYRDDGIITTDVLAPGFPGVTICSLSPIKVNDDDLENMTVTQYASLSLGYPYMGVGIKHRMKIFEMFLKNNNNMTYTLQLEMDKLEKELKEQMKSTNLYQYIVENSHSCSEMFGTCFQGLGNVNCCQIFRPVLTNMGLCFIMNQYLYQNFYLESNIPVIIDLINIENPGEEYENGYFVTIHDPHISPKFFSLNSGTLVSPGAVTNMKVIATLTDYRAKYTSWFGLKQECPTSNGQSGQNYNMMDCSLWAADRVVRTFCNCSWILSPLENENGLEICGPIEMTQCILVHASEIFRAEKGCRPPCFDYIYDATVSNAELTQKRSKKRSRISISYDGQNFFHHIYHRHYLSSLFSDIGGATGLLLGASSITGLELVILLCQWCYCKIWSKR